MHSSIAGVGMCAHDASRADESCVMGDSGTVHALLMQEAQQEIASLRTELYNTRRTAEERRQLVGQLTSRVQELEAQTQSLEGSLSQCRAELAKLQGVDAQLASLHESTQRLQRELEASVSAKRILAGELAEERQQRQQAEQAKATLESERSKLQKARAEMAAQLRLAEKTAKDAEGEQLHAEQEVQALRQELAMLRSSSMGPSGHEGADSAAVAAATAAASMADHKAALLMEQLENERSRTAVLMDTLHAAKAELEALKAQAGSAGEAASEGLKPEVAALRAELSRSQAQVHNLQQQLQSSATELAAARHAASTAQTAADAAMAAAAAAQSSAAAAGGQGQALGGLVPEPHRLLNRDQRPASSSESLSALLATGSAGAGEAELVAQLERFQAQVQKLKQSRDKLLEEIDSQWEEMDRLSSEHKAAAAEAATQKQLAITWESQAQDALAHVERLKELLEESAAWGAGEGAAAGGLAGKSAVEVAAALQSQLLKEKARAADLEAGARALAAELVRAQHASVSIGRSVLPVLCGIEHRLGGMCDDAQGALQQWRQQRAHKGGRQELALTGGPGAAAGGVGSLQQPVG